MASNLLFLFIFAPIFLISCTSWFLDADLYPADLKAANLDKFYEYKFEYKDNNNTYIFRLTDGDLPIGMSVIYDGRLVGTPRESGVFEFEVTLIESTSTSTNIDLDCLFETPEEACQNDSEDISDKDSGSESDSEWFVLEVNE